MKEVFNELNLIAYRTTGDKEKAKDLAQEMAIKMIENRDTCQRLYKEGKLLNWLYRIARNLWIDHHRKQVNEIEIQDYHRKEADDFIPRMDNGKMIDFLNKHCWFMDVSWVMVYIDCGSYSEVARRFEVSRQQAKVRIDEARERIKEEIKKHPDYDFF